MDYARKGLLGRTNYPFIKKFRGNGNGKVMLKQPNTKLCGLGLSVEN